MQKKFLDSTEKQDLNTPSTELSTNLLEDGYSHFLKKELPQALDAVQLFLQTPSLEVHKKEYAKAQLLLGKIHLNQHEYVHSTLPLLKAMEYFKILNDNIHLAQTNLQMGVLYNRVFHYPRALHYLQLTKNSYWKYLSVTDQVELLTFLGISLFRLEQLDTAEACFETAVKLIQEGGLDKSKTASPYAYLGKIEKINNKIKPALIFAKKANDIIEKFGDIEGTQVNLINLGSIHCQLEKYNEGIKLASRGIAAAKRLKDGFYEIRGYQIMAEIFRKKKDYKSAVMYQMIYTKFYEDFYQRNDRQKISEIESDFKISQLQKEIERLKKDEV